jgi:hypothetical protein
MTVTLTIDKAEKLQLLGWEDLTADERRQFPYLSSDVERSEAEFVRYRGNTYDTAELEPVEVPGRLAGCGFTSFKATSFRGGVVFKYVERGHAAQMATYDFTASPLPAERERV